MSNPKYGPGYEKSKDKTRAKKRVLHLLESSQKSEKQLRDKLKEGGYEPDVIDEAIDYAKSYHYIDDERFARDFVRLSCHNKSRIRLKQDLSQKGIDKDIIDIAIEEEYVVDEVELLKDLLRKRHFDSEADYAEKQKHFRYLASKGYSTSVIRRAMDMDDEYTGVQSDL